MKFLTFLFEVFQFSGEQSYHHEVNALTPCMLYFLKLCVV